MNERPPFGQQNAINVEYSVLGQGQPPPLPRKSGARLNVLLFIATLLTTTYAGALMEVQHPGQALEQIYRGLPFSVTLLTILLFHEFGHYFMARKHGVEATLPYFIPAPSIIGTFGAVIKMRSPHSKRSLLDIGATGPLAGVVVAIPAIVIGLRLSEITPLSKIEGGISLGSSLLFSFLSWLSVGILPEQTDILLHPVAFAGWIGLLVTMLNLLPIGQLDGGHVAYALLGREWHRVTGYIVLPVLFFLGLRAWQGWLVWCLLLLFVMGVKHPATMDDEEPLDRTRTIIGWIAILLFILTFTPAPFTISLFE